MLESTRAGLKDAKISPDIFEQTKVTADAGYHSGASVAYTQEKGIDAYIADRSHRQRDPALQTMIGINFDSERTSVVIVGSIPSGLRPRTSFTMRRLGAAGVRRAIVCIETAATSR